MSRLLYQVLRQEPDGSTDVPVGIHVTDVGGRCPRAGEVVKIEFEEYVIVDRSETLADGYVGVLRVRPGCADSRAAG